MWEFAKMRILRLSSPDSRFRAISEGLSNNIFDQYSGMMIHTRTPESCTAPPCTAPEVWCGGSRGPEGRITFMEFSPGQFLYLHYHPGRRHYSSHIDGKTEAGGGGVYTVSWTSQSWDLDSGLIAPELKSLPPKRFQ